VYIKKNCAIYTCIPVPFPDPMLGSWVETYTYCFWYQQWQVPPQTFLISPDLRNWSCSEEQRSSAPGVNQSSPASL